MARSPFGAVALAGVMRSVIACILGSTSLVGAGLEHGPKTGGISQKAYIRSSHVLKWCVLRHLKVCL